MSATSLYGTAKRKITYKKRVKHKIEPYTRKGKLVKGYTARRWHKITRITKKPLTKRFTFYGTAKDIEKAKRIMEKEGLIPRQKYEDQINAYKFWKDRQYRKRHSVEGDWTDFEETESP
ncbi:hypothetical protein E3J74_09155 [Candidatus Bathyarchaeota archaeon]|nr:MAG: hypothetical protein E3J74_09155 [Candidatus Bathyarchaeota archaeon]